MTQEEGNAITFRNKYADSYGGEAYEEGSCEFHKRVAESMLNGMTCPEWLQ